jgi:hypothetical protein
MKLSSAMMLNSVELVTISVDGHENKLHAIRLIFRKDFIKANL